MPATLEALVNFIKESHTIETIVDGGGIVKFVSQVEDKTTAESLEPGTLAVTAGIMITSVVELDELIVSLATSRAAGLIMTMDITPTKRLLPIFRMPVATKIPRLIYETTRFLIRSESKELTIARAMKSILSGSAQNESALRYLEQHGFPAKANYYLLVSDSGCELSRGCSFRFEGSYLTILCGAIRSACIEVANMLDGRVGISEFTSPDELPVAYKRSLSAFRTASMTDVKFIFYGEDGIYGLMRSFSDSAEATDFADRLLDPIKEYDKNNRTDYLDTLKAYIRANGSVQETSEKLGIHRNTVNNKIRFIKENFALSFDFAGVSAIVAALAIDEFRQYNKGDN